MEALYGSIEAATSSQALGWFNGLARAIYSLEHFPDRGRVIHQNKKLRHLLFGRKPSVYKIIYGIDKLNLVVSVLHIRHAARDSRSPD